MRTAGALILAARMVLASVTLAAPLAACSQSPCESAGTCYHPPNTTFYGGSYYMDRGGFSYGGRGH